MSFTAEVKDELSRVEPTCSRCDEAELSALIRMLGTYAISGSDGARLNVATESACVARTVIRLLHSVYDLRTELTVRRSVLHKTSNYLISVPGGPELTAALRSMGVLGGDSGLEPGIKPELVERGCCAGAYLRGAFLASGYIADPKGDFHFELTSSSQVLAEGFVELMAANGVRARSIRRHSSYLVYIKGVDQIIAFLAFAGAHRSALAIEEARVLKSVRNDTNRRVNAEIANQVKTTNAALRQIECIQAIIDTCGLDALPPALREVALLRLDNPDASIKELGELAEPPLSKSAVNHRLRRIEEMAGDKDA